MVMWSCGIYILFLLVPYWVDDYFEVQSLLPNLVWLNMLQKHSADMSLEVRHANHDSTRTQQTRHDFDLTSVFLTRGPRNRAYGTNPTCIASLLSALVSAETQVRFEGFRGQCVAPSVPAGVAAPCSGRITVTHGSIDILGGMRRAYTSCVLAGPDTCSVRWDCHNCSFFGHMSEVRGLRRPYVLATLKSACVPREGPKKLDALALACDNMETHCVCVQVAMTVLEPYSLRLRTGCHDCARALLVHCVCVQVAMTVLEPYSFSHAMYWNASTTSSFGPSRAIPSYNPGRSFRGFLSRAWCAFS